MKTLKIFLLTILVLLPFLASAQVSNNDWKVLGGILQPVLGTWQLKIPQLGGSGTTCLQVDNTGLLSVTGAACGSGGGSGSGTVSTSTPLVNGQVDFSTGVSTIGNDSTFLFNTTSKVLTINDILALASSTLQAFTFTNATGSQATTTNLFATIFNAITASTTNLTVANTITGSVSGNAGTATKLATGRTIGITGDLTYTSPSFDGSSNVTAAGTLATVNSNVGSFGGANSIPSFTVNGKGLITAASANTPSIPASEITSETFGTGDYTFPANLVVTTKTISTNFLATGSSTLQNFTAVNATTSQATTTALAISGIASGNCLHTTTGGAIVGTGSDCGSGSGAVSSVSDDGRGTLTISPTTGAVLAGINLGNSNVYTAASTTFVNGVTIGRATTTSATTTNFSINGDSFTDLTGTGLTVSGNALTVSNVPNSALQNSTISGVALGSNLNSLSHDSTLTGTSYNGSAAVSNWGIDLTHANTWTGNQMFLASTTIGNSTTAGGLTIAGRGTTTSFVITGLGTPAGTFLAVDSLGNVIATTTPINTGGSSQGVNWATNAVLAGTPTYNNGTSGVGATLTEVGSGALSVDGNNPAAGDRVLVKNQASALQNGIYSVTATGSGIASYVLTRTTDYNTPTEITPGLTTYVVSGTANTDTTWAVSYVSPLSIGSTALNYTEVSGGGAAVSSVTNSDGTLTISPTTGNVVASLNLGAQNIWTGASTTFVGLSLTRSTTTSATSTNLFATTASTTNLFLATGNGCLQVTNGQVLSTGSNCGSSSGITDIGNGFATTTGPKVTFSTSTDSTTGLTSGLTITVSGTTVNLKPTLTGTLSTANGGTGLSNPGSTGTGVLLQFNGSGGASAVTPAFPNCVFGSNDGSNYGCGLTVLSGGNSNASTLTLEANTSAQVTLRSGLYTGIGTTTPNFLLQLATSTKPQLALSDGSLTSNHWTLRNTGGTLYFATASPTTFATSTSAALTIDNNGFLTIPADAGTGCAQFDTNGKVTNTGSACGSGGGANPAGTGSELQYRLNSTTFGAVTNSAFNSTAGTLGIGTTTPYFELSLASTTPIFDLTATGAGTNQKHIIQGNYSGVFAIGTSSDTNLNSTSTALSLNMSLPTQFIVPNYFSTNLNGTISIASSTATSKTLPTNPALGSIYYASATGSPEFYMGTTTSYTNGLNPSAGWVAGGGCVWLSSTTTAASQASASTTDFSPNFKFLHANIYIAGYSASSIAQMSFNGDTGTNYAYTVSANDAAPRSLTNATGTPMGSTSITTQRFVSLDIRNDASKAKGVTGMGEDAFESAATAPTIEQIAGGWANTSTGIHQITVNGGRSGVTLNAGTRIDVWGCDSPS